MRVCVPPSQELADRHTLVAQKYAGHFVGHPYRAAQQRVGPDAISVDRTCVWREPEIVRDGCEFCQRLTDEEAERRVAGYQHAIDIEAIRPYAALYTAWLATCPDAIAEEIVVEGRKLRRGVMDDSRNRRRFLEDHALQMQHAAIPLVDLPLRLKRKLCIEWNHLYVEWMARTPGLRYDHATREFFREAEEAERIATPSAADAFTEWWRQLAGHDIPAAARRVS
jgi:hypothetical protein